jgi:hypothetical protein
LLRGVASEADALKIRGVRVINEDNVIPGANPSEYVFTRKTVTTNLFRLYFEP